MNKWNEGKMGGRGYHKEEVDVDDEPERAAPPAKKPRPAVKPAKVNTPISPDPPFAPLFLRLSFWRASPPPLGMTVLHTLMYSNPQWHHSKPQRQTPKNPSALGIKVRT